MHAVHITYKQSTHCYRRGRRGHTQTHAELYKQTPLSQACAGQGKTATTKTTSFPTEGKGGQGEGGGHHSRRHAVLPPTLTASGRFVAAVLTVIVAVTDPLHRDADAVAAGEEASWARAG